MAKLLGHPTHTAALISVGLACFVLVGPTTTAQTIGTPERYTALAANLNARSPVASTTMVEIVVTRWSSGAERDRLLKVLFDNGPDKLLDLFQETPRVGYIRTSTSLGWDLRYSRRVSLPDGGEQVTLATDRPISFYEASTQARTIEYPFTLIELRLGQDGNGEGKMSVATKIIPDKDNNTIVLEDWAAQPVLLQGVKRAHRGA
jgi:hypothetical protein